MRGLKIHIVLKSHKKKKVFQRIRTVGNILNSPKTIFDHTKNKRDLQGVSRKFRSVSLHVFSFVGLVVFRVSYSGYILLVPPSSTSSSTGPLYSDVM